MSKFSDKTVKIVLSENDMKSFGISFEMLDSDEITAKMFLGSIITLVKSLEIIEISGEVTIDISQNEKHEMEIFITSSQEKPVPECTSTAYLFKDFRQLTEFCKSTVSTSGIEVKSSELYIGDKDYLLTVDYCCSPEEIFENNGLCKNVLTNIVSVAKAKEHRKLISRTPLKKISEIP